MRNRVLRWTHELAHTARVIASNRVARAPESPEMPRELREVARSFNTMIERQDQRERSLEEALAHNQHLARELHHRVKNSLQIVQSYLGLTKRNHTGEARRVLLMTECRVHVLSTGYRLALQNGEMRAVPLDEFFDCIAANVSSSLRESTQRVEPLFETGLNVEIDRAIPLGLILVEVLVIALENDVSASVTVRGSATPDGVGVLAINSAPAATIDSQRRLLNGLVQQASATLETGDGEGDLLLLRLPAN